MVIFLHTSFFVKEQMQYCMLLFHFYIIEVNAENSCINHVVVFQMNNK